VLPFDDRAVTAGALRRWGSPSAGDGADLS
jgi:hypothetical protein